MHKDSDEAKEGSEWTSLIWVMVICLIVVLLLALPAALVWRTAEMRRAARDAEMRMMEEDMQRLEEEMRRRAREQAPQEGPKQPQKETAREPAAGKK